MLSFLQYIIVATLRLGTPIAVTSMGGCFSQRSGINNIGLDAQMTMGALMGACGSYWFNNAWIGVLIGMTAGVAMGLIHGFVVNTCGAPMAVSSQALILFSEGLTIIILAAVFGNIGYSDQVAAISSTPILENIPVVGPMLSQLSPLVYIGIIILLVLNFWLYKTSAGLHFQSCGENPRAADTAGINVNLFRYAGVMASGALGGLGGAMLSIGYMNLFQDGMIAGRGFLALGAISLGGNTLKGAYAAGLLFGFFDALQLYIQTTNMPVPSQFVQMIPYLASLLVIVFASGKRSSRRGQPPAALGQPYSKISGTR